MYRVRIKSNKTIFAKKYELKILLQTIKILQNKTLGRRQTSANELFTVEKQIGSLFRNVLQGARGSDLTYFMDLWRCH